MKQQNSHECETTIKFCVYLTDMSSGDSRACDCTFQCNEQNVFEKTLNIPLGNPKEPGMFFKLLQLKDIVASSIYIYIYTMYAI